MRTLAPPEDRKHSDSLLARWEHRLIARMIRHVPAWVRPQHLTVLTLLWSVLVLANAALSRSQVRWLWALSAVIALQYVTDAIDGKVGKIRNAGLVRWGYYMDHLLDYVFLCAILLGYSMLLPERSQYLMTMLLAIAGGFMVSSFLARSVSGVLTISYLKIGPIEIRLIFIVINVWLATAGQAYMLGVMPYVIGASLVTLCALVFETQRTLWNLDRSERDSAAPVAGRRQGFGMVDRGFGIGDRGFGIRESGSGTRAARSDQPSSSNSSSIGGPKRVGGRSASR